MVYRTSRKGLAPLLNAIGYAGRKIGFCRCTDVTIDTATDGLWSGGTCDKWYAVKSCADGSLRLSAAATNEAAPWGRGRAGHVSLNIPRGVAIIRRSWFCGSDMGVTIYVSEPIDLRDPISVTSDNAALIESK